VFRKFKYWHIENGSFLLDETKVERNAATEFDAGYLISVQTVVMDIWKFGCVDAKRIYLSRLLSWVCGVVG
jgi:hypothetical protein